MKVHGGSYDYWNTFFFKKTQGKREEDFFVKV